MNETQQRIAIAEFCGWVKEIHPTPISPEGRNFWRSSNTKPGYATHIEFNLPDYLYDLNAIHEAEKYIGLHDNDFKGRKLKRMWKNVIKAIDPQFATAKERSEALLRIVGLWKD